MAEVTATATAKPQYEKADQLYKDHKFQESLDLLRTFEVFLQFLLNGESLCNNFKILEPIWPGNHVEVWKSPL